MMCQRAGDGKWRCLSWAQAWSQARSLAGALLRLGFGGGRPIATLSGNSLEQAVLRLGAMLAGVPLVHLSPAYSLLSRDHAQLKAALALVPCAAVFVQDTTSFAPALASVAEFAGIDDVIAAHGAAPGQQDFAELVAGPVDEPALARAQRSIAPSTWCAVYFTSGSTGQPKAVPVTHGMLEAQQRMTLGRVPPHERRPQVWLDWLPWHHVFAGVANLGRLLAVGGTYYIDEGRPLANQFEATLRNLRDVAPTSYVSSPMAFTRLAGELETDDTLARQFFSRLEGMGYGGASLPGETWRRMQQLAVRYTGHKLPFLCGLGSTETAAAGISLYWPCDDTASIGLPLPEVELKLVPLEHQTDLGGRFEMRIRGAQVFQGYIGRPDLNAAAFDQNGFYRLGDAVRFVDPGDPLRGLRFDGRVAEDFKLASGTWVRSGAVRVQAVSLLSPLVTDAVVCGLDREVIDGIEIEFQLTPETEAPSEMHFFFPGERALNLAENATHNLHNLCPLRGAQVRDALAWSKYLHVALHRYGARSDVVLADLGQCAGAPVPVGATRPVPRHARPDRAADEPWPEAGGNRRGAHLARRPGQALARAWLLRHLVAQRQGGVPALPELVRRAPGQPAQPAAGAGGPQIRRVHGRHGCAGGARQSRLRAR